MKYSDKLKDPRWQKKRLEILSRDEFKCKSCNTEEKELQVHHMEKHDPPWDAPTRHLITLCKTCHDLMHKLQWVTPYYDELHSIIEVWQQWQEDVWHEVNFKLERS